MIKFFFNSYSKNDYVNVCKIFLELKIKIEKYFKKLQFV